MSARTDLRDHLADTLGDAYQCYAAVVNLGAIPANIQAAIVVDAPTFEPAPNAQGALLITSQVHLVIDVADPTLAADRFDDVLDDVFRKLDADGGLLWTEAKPSQYDPSKPSYVITIITTTAKG